MSKMRIKDKTKGKMTNQFKTVIQVEVPSDLYKYINRPKDSLSQSLLNELAKAQVSEDVAEALRTFGMKGQIKLTRKVQNVK